MTTLEFSALNEDAGPTLPGEQWLRVRGGTPLHGEVHVRGAKNTLPKNMVASLLTDEDCVLDNVASVVDVEIVGQMIQALGGTIEKTGPGRLRMRTSDPQVLSAQQGRAFRRQEPHPSADLRTAARASRRGRDP